MSQKGVIANAESSIILKSNCSMKKTPPKRVNFSDFITIFAVSVSFYTFSDFAALR